ncbi:hypothetical protein L7F22_025694 [Adiantum nelumboides]|nr:hypothetical protein [Adiantum nelumboides]
MEIAIGVSVGSSIQIAVGVIPSLVLLGWAVGQPLTLYFQSFETVVLVASVVLVNTPDPGRAEATTWRAPCSSPYMPFAALSFWVERTYERSYQSFACHKEAKEELKRPRPALWIMEGRERKRKEGEKTIARNGNLIVMCTGYASRFFDGKRIANAACLSLH